MFRLLIKRSFDAAHSLPDHPGKCRAVHGHRWEVEVEVSAKNIGDDGMLIDFADVKKALDEVLSGLDHKYLNDLPSFTVSPPTAENVAVVIARKMQNKICGVTAVTVWETAGAGIKFEI